MRCGAGCLGGWGGNRRHEQRRGFGRRKAQGSQTENREKFGSRQESRTRAICARRSKRSQIVTASPGTPASASSGATHTASQNAQRHERQDSWDQVIGPDRLRRSPSSPIRPSLSGPPASTPPPLAASATCHRSLRPQATRHFSLDLKPRPISAINNLTLTCLDPSRSSSAACYG